MFTSVTYLWLQISDPTKTFNLFWQDIAGYSGMIPVAVKTLTSRDPDVVRKFHEEAELMKKFSHPKIVSLLGTYSDVLYARV